MPEPQAIDRYTTEVPEGQTLARQHGEAVVDYQPEEIVEKQERVGGDAAEAIAKKLDLAAQEYSLLHGVGRDSAHDHVLATPEGQELREKYSQLVRD